MRSSSLILLTAVIVALAGCGSERCEDCEKDGHAGHGAAAGAAVGAAADPHAGHGAAAGASKEACAMPAALVAVMSPTKGNTVGGKVRFTEVAGGVRVVADISGLTPGGKHAFHIHEFGDVSAEDGSAAGGHYNPGGHPHGGPEAEHHHAGDLGNLTADAAGNAHYEIVVKGLSLCCGGTPVIGRSVIIHAKEDDLASQPAGNAGPRIAQGVIGAGK
jgi:superoxide dismutase, Cu-Zn family